MSEANLNAFHELAESPKVWEGTYLFAKGSWSRTTVIQVEEGWYLVYSPSESLIQDAIARGLDSAKKITIIAPNKYHTLGIKSWQARFPHAKVYCTDQAKPRVEKKSGVAIWPISDLIQELPAHIKVYQTNASKTGEVWLHIREANHNILVLCDAYFNIQRIPPKGLAHWFYRFNRMGPGLAISRIFMLVGVGNRKAYYSWLKSTTEEIIPTLLIPCHGSLLRSQQLQSLMIDLANKHVR